MKQIFAILIMLMTIFPAVSYAQDKPRSGLLLVSQGDITRITDGGSEERISPGVAVHEGDQIQTSFDGQAQIMMLDRSVLFLGNNASAYIERFNYSNDPNESAFSVDIERGSFRVVTGQIGRQEDAVKVNIKSAIVDVNNGELSGHVEPEFANVVLLSGQAKVETIGGDLSLKRSGWGIEIDANGLLKEMKKFEAESLVNDKPQNASLNNSDFDLYLLGALSKRGEAEEEDADYSFEIESTKQNFGQSAKNEAIKISSNPIEAVQVPEPVSQESSTEDNYFGLNITADPIAENIDTSQQVQVGSISVLGKNNEGASFSLVSSDSNLFTVSSGGLIYLAQNADLNFETDNEYEIEVQGSNSSGDSATQTVKISLTDTNQLASAVSLTNSVVPDVLIYDMVEVTSGNILDNPELANNAQGWRRYLNGSNLDYIEGDEFWASDGYSHVYQTVNLASDAGLSSYDAVNGGTILWDARAWSNSDTCDGGGTGCGDHIKIGIKTLIDGTSTRYAFEETNYVSDWFDVNETTTITDQATSFDYFAGGTDDAGDDHVKGSGPKITDLSLRYRYQDAQDLVVGELSATDKDSANTHSYAISSDSSGLFELRGNQLILNGGSELDASATASYTIQIAVTDSDGGVATLPITVTVNDVGNTATDTTQALTATEGTEFTKTVDFGDTGATVTAADLPSWLTLSDLSNGLARVTGTPGESGEKSFTLTSTNNGATTTAHYVLTAADDCTGAYCTTFVSSADTENIASYSTSGGLDYVNSVQYSAYSSWNDLHTTMSTGTGSYTRENIALTTNNGGGTWTGNMRFTVDYTNRTIESLTWGTFSNHTLGSASNAAGAFTSRGSTAFETGSDCTTVGGCTLTDSVSSFTCTGSAQCTEDNHGSVNTTVTADFTVLKNASDVNTALGELNITDTANGNVQAASLGKTVLLAD